MHDMNDKFLSPGDQISYFKIMQDINLYYNFLTLGSYHFLPGGGCLSVMAGC